MACQVDSQSHLPPSRHPGAQDLSLALTHREGPGLLVDRQRDRAQARDRARPHRRVEILDGVEPVQLVGEPPQQL